jgi:pimeloyl-ACP methyl ester carboxylesterase
MRTKTLPWIGLTLGFLLASASPRVLAQSNPVYVPLSGGAKAMLYMPDGNPTPQVAVLTVHRTGNKFSSLECAELSKRGFAVLCLNTRFENNEAIVDWEKIPLDLKQGVEYLKSKQGIAKVVLFGHSGGGATTTFYQAVAENGPSYCQGPNKLTQCDDTLAGLPPADGILVVDAHPAIAVNTLRAINPAVFNEERPDLVRPDLDPFNPANGYNPKGASRYSDDFKRRYSVGQAKRLNEWIDRALYTRKLMEEGKWIYPDDDSIIIPRAADRATNLFSMDPGILCCTSRPHKLLKNDGTIATQIIQSVRPPDTTRAKPNGTFDVGARVLTVTSFLSANAIRATESLDYDKIDWCSTNNSVPCALRNITVPILIIAMGAHYFVSDSEFFLENAKSADKDFITIAGATHGITPCRECAGGPYDNSVKNFFDYVAKWMNARFPAR